MTKKLLSRQTKHAESRNFVVTRDLLSRQKIITTWKSLLRQKTSSRERPLSRQGNVCRDTERKNLYRNKVMYVAMMKEEEMLVATDKQGRDM